jgi:hypothetical protein
MQYHCNNWCFHDNAFRQVCHDVRQQLTFCGVNAHFQNSIAKQAIHDLLESARKQLLHARARWQAAVHFALWLYALHNAVHLHNNLPVLEDGTLRLELFSSIRVGSNMKHAHTFGCPVFALQNVLASGNQLPCGSPCALLGLNLGASPMHARNIFLVLNLVTGCVSPQYHHCFDDFFETAHHSTPDVSGTICWKQLVGLGVFIFYEAIGYGQGRLLTSRWAAEMTANGIIECWVGIMDICGICLLRTLNKIGATHAVLPFPFHSLRRPPHNRSTLKPAASALSCCQ